MNGQLRGWSQARLGPPTVSEVRICPPANLSIAIKTPTTKSAADLPECRMEYNCLLVWGATLEGLICSLRLQGKRLVPKTPQLRTGGIQTGFCRLEGGSGHARRR